MIKRLAKKAGVTRSMSGDRFRHWRAIDLYQRVGGFVDIAARAIGNSPEVFRAHYLQIDESQIASLMQQSTAPEDLELSSFPENVTYLKGYKNA